MDMPHVEDWNCLIDQIVKLTLLGNQIGLPENDAECFRVGMLEKGLPFSELDGERWISDTLVPDSIKQTDCWILEDVLSESRLEEINNGDNETSDEFRSYLREWILNAFEDMDSECVAGFTFIELKDTEENTCVCLATVTGHSFSNLAAEFEGFFSSEENGTEFLKMNGFVESDVDSETVIKSFLDRHSKLWTENAARRDP
jgi:hypothetical protein